MCTYSYLRFVIVFFFLLCTFGTLWANYSMAFPEKVPGSDKNTATVRLMQPLVGSSCCVLQPKYGFKFQLFVALVTFMCLYL